MRLPTFGALLMAACGGSVRPTGSAAPTSDSAPLATAVVDASAALSPSVAVSTTVPLPLPTPASVLRTDAPGCHRLALALVVDRSGSMSGQPIEDAKAAVKAAMDLLSKEDCVTVIAFDSEPTRIVALSARSDETEAAVDRIQAGGGTDFLPALVMAHGDLALAHSAKHKHVIFLSDGQAAEADLKRMAQSMAADSMTMTTVGLGSGADGSVLRMMADIGGGRFYNVPDASQLTRVFTKDVELVKQAYRWP